ncbi:MAG TPA: hypothetical protein VGB68_17420, partial [Pyrinomonadaceae bacterium]
IAEIIAQRSEQFETREFNRQLFSELCIQSAVTFEKYLRRRRNFTIYCRISAVSTAGATCFSISIYLKL